MSVDHCDEVGWPAEALPVHNDPTPILGRLPRMATRLCALDRHARYRHRRGNARRRELYRLSKEAR